MNMDEMRETALAYYANMPESQKQLASEFFKSLDTDGDGKVDVREYIAGLSKEGITWINNSGIFKELDINGNGSLDFVEVLTLFYMIESGRFVFCDGCRALLKGVYFTCLSCFNSGPTGCDSFDLCCSCYRNHKFQHHDDATFVDNYRLLRSQRQQSAPRNQSRRKRFVKKTMHYVSAGSSTLNDIFQLADALSKAFSS